MQTAVKHKIFFLVLLLILFFAFIVNISLGSVAIPLKQIFHALSNGELNDENWRYLILGYRIPKAITAILAGVGLSVSGLLMQTLFRNPLAGPYVLGISSGASLGVAILVLGAFFLGFESSLLSNSSWALVIASSLGSLLVLFTVLVLAKKMQNTMSILIIGLMFGSLTSAIVSILAFFSSAEQLQQFIFWSFGSLGNLSWQELGILSAFVGLGLGLVLFILKEEFL